MRSQAKIWPQPAASFEGVLADPDDDVITLMRSGQRRDALQRLMHRYGSAVFRYCQAALRDAASAEDVRQLVFIEAYRNLDRFGGRSTVRTWLFAIARHRTLDALKTQRRVSHHRLDEATLDRLPDPRPPTGDFLDDQRVREALFVCLGKLPRATRTALLLHYQQGFSFEEMGEICAMKPGTLQARVARALPRLRDAIERVLANPQRAGDVTRPATGAHPAGATSNPSEPPASRLGPVEPTCTELGLRG